MDWFLIILQFAVSGATAGAALFFANIALDRYRKPALSVDKEHFLEPVRIDLPLYIIDVEGFPQDVREYRVQYLVNRVTIRNLGRNAAENCKGALRINDREEKICWNVPSEAYKMTINADSEEYLDVCAVLGSETKDVFDQLQKKIESFGNGKEGSVAKAILNEIYKSQDDVKSIIAPTENGWQTPVHRNRPIRSGHATIVVTSKNAKPTLKQEITILEKKEANGRIIRWRDNAGSLTRRNNSRFWRKRLKLW
jgi:hypothetical protein